MLRSGVGRLYKGVATAAASPSLLSDTASRSAATSSSRLSSLCRQLTSSSRRTRRSIPSHNSAPFTTTSSTASFHSESYFSSARPDFVSSQSSDLSPGKTHVQRQQSERYLPPFLNVDLVAHNRQQQALYDAILDQNADLSWNLYRQLRDSRFDVSASAFDLLITLQCRKAVRSQPGQADDIQSSIRQVCSRVLQLCQDRSRSRIGSSTKVSAKRDDAGLSTLSAPLALRLLYLLVVEEEQIAASKSSRRTASRPNLSRVLETLSTHLDAYRTTTGEQLDAQLRGRLAATLSRLGATDAAYRQLRSVVQQAEESDEASSIDPRPFDQLLSALARQRTDKLSRSEYLPSPIDTTRSAVDENDPLLQALRLTIVSGVSVSKASVHKCLQALDTSTLWWLLPFESDGSNSAEALSKQLPDDRYALRAKWHPWQTSNDGTVLSQETLDPFAERVALVLAQRGVLQPALHILPDLQSIRIDSDPSQDSSRGWPRLHGRIPDHDLFTVILEQLLARMAATNASDARKTIDTHRGISLDLHLAVKVYSVAEAVGVDLDPRMNEAVIKAFATCLPTAVVDLGSARTLRTNVKAHIAKRNEENGSRHTLQNYLRRFTLMILKKDPDLSKGSLSFPAQATLFGLHSRCRDFSFSKRLYQLIRIREPARELWSNDPESGSLVHSALHPLAAPDVSTFHWLFSQSLRATAKKSSFALRLYLDWLASGNSPPDRLTALFVQTLLRAKSTAVVQRVIQEIQEERIELPARLARSLTASFAEAGFPDLAVEIALTVSRATVATAMLPSLGANFEESLRGSASWQLTSSLTLISVAMDRSSRVLTPQDEVLYVKLLRLFDDFRLGLTHHLLIASANTNSERRSGATLHKTVSLQDIRLAYNASMRAHSTMILDSFRSEATSMEQETTTAWKETEATCSHVDKLFEEMEDLGVQPDSDSWTLRLASHVHACLQAPIDTEREARLHRSLELYKQACGQVFAVDAPLLASSQKSSSDRLYTSTSAQENLHQVKVHPGVASALIGACRQCNDLKSGLGVYESHKRQNHSTCMLKRQD